MTLLQSLLFELQHESEKTRKIIEAIPEQELQWRPHKKSRSLVELAIHIAEIPGWLHYTLDAEELDFAKLEYSAPDISSKAALLQLYQEKMVLGGTSLNNTSNETLLGNWKLRNGDYIILDMQRLAVIRDLVMNHIAHHRGQLSVYLRMLNVPVPGLYGPSADE